MYWAISLTQNHAWTLFKVWISSIYLAEKPSSVKISFPCWLRLGGDVMVSIGVWGELIGLRTNLWLPTSFTRFSSAAVWPVKRACRSLTRPQGIFAASSLLTTSSRVNPPNALLSSRSKYYLFWTRIWLEANSGLSGREKTDLRL